MDVGGATTDIYSVADGMPEHMNTVYKGLPEPYAKRTVEGDIGMRYSIQGVIDSAGIDKICALSGLSEDTVLNTVEDLKRNPDKIPDNDETIASLDFALASCAVDEAVTRHAGTISETFTLLGKVLVQEGKNLTSVKNIVVTGGSLIHSEKVCEIAGHARYSAQKPASLRPTNADIWVDKQYILSAMGLLSSYYPETALNIMKKELDYYGDTK